MELDCIDSRPQVTFVDNNDANDGNNPSQCGEQSISPPSVLITPMVG